MDIINHKPTLQIGGVEVYSDGTIIAGGMRFHSSRVRVRLDDDTRQSTHASTFGAVLAVLTFWVFLLGLLFLLLRETRISGYMFLTVEDKVDGRIWVQPLHIDTFAKQAKVIRLFSELQLTVARAQEVHHVNS